MTVEVPTEEPEAKGLYGRLAEIVWTRRFGLRQGAIGDAAHVGLQAALRLGIGLFEGAPGDELRQGLVAADVGGEHAIAFGLLGLLAQLSAFPSTCWMTSSRRSNCPPRLSAALRLVAARVQAGDAGGLLQDQSPRLRLGGNDFADLALADQDGRARAGRGVGKQQLHVAGARLAAVDAIGRAGFALDAAVTSMTSCSLKAAGARRSELSSTSPTSAMLREGRLPEPEKMTSSMPEARMFL